MPSIDRIIKLLNKLIKNNNKSTKNKDDITRFSLSQRIEHIILLISFSLLGITGLAQKYALSSIGQMTLRIFGGIESSREIHHIAAITLGAISGYHIIAVLYRIIVLQVNLSILPNIEDFQHLLQDVGYYLGFRQTKAFYGRFSYAEKVEYLAVVWGVLIMGITGFMMWNPIATSRLLPGEFIPAAKAAHGGEAVLAVLAIIIWHFYHVHIKHFNKSMFTGKLSLKEMQMEHPAELIEINMGLINAKNISDKLLKKRKIFFIPMALILSLIFMFSLYKFITFEKTAIITVLRGESSSVYVPITPTPSLIPTTTPTFVPDLLSKESTWIGGIEELFRNRCKNCHGLTKVGGLSLATYEDALKGGNSGPGIVPGNPQRSEIVLIQQQGNHPGQLSIDELNLIIEWVKSDAPK